ncbi:MAG: HNH endonuclease [Bacteroidota bacterium]
METQKCPLCQRELGEINISKHHLIPKSKGGTFGETVMLHNICHQKIHSVFSEKELRDDYNTIEKLLANEQIAKFVKWVAKKEIGFYERNKRMKKK